VGRDLRRRPGGAPRRVGDENGGLTPHQRAADGSLVTGSAAIDRLASKIDFDVPRVLDTRCWVWTGHVHQRSGYGRFRLQGRVVEAHRASYLLLVGEIAPDLELDHLCRRRACVNPNHLEAVPPQGEHGPQSAGRTLDARYAIGEVTLSKRSPVRPHRRARPSTLQRLPRRTEPAIGPAATWSTSSAGRVGLTVTGDSFDDLAVLASTSLARFRNLPPGMTELRRVGERTHSGPWPARPRDHFPSRQQSTTRHARVVKRVDPQRIRRPPL
jgi:hypothetical protein